MKQGILPSEVDKQDLDILLWIALSPDKGQEADVSEGAIMGLL